MISVSIVTYHTDNDELTRCLASLNCESVKQIYIVDNSSDAATEQLCRDYPNVTYIASKNVGYGAGHNIAIRRVLAAKSADYHLVLNSDVSFSPDVLDRLTDYLDKNQDVALVQPRIEYPDGRLQYTCRLLPTPANLIFRRFLPKALISKMDRRYTLAFWDHSTPIDAAYLQGSFLLFRAEAFDVVGLFDERFFMYPEDIDITRRMNSQFRAVYLPEVSIVHDHRAASYKDKRMLRIHATNMVRYFNKWGWLFDSQRSRYNNQLLRQLNYKK